MENKIEIISIDGIVDNHTCRRLFPVVKDPGMKDPDDIVEYQWKQKVKKVGKGEDDYLVEEVVVEASRVNRQQFIAKDADQVGVLNILEKVRRSGDNTLVNQLGYVAPPSNDVDSLGRPLGAVQDFRNAPHNVQGVLDGMKKGAASYEAIKALFPGVSFSDLANMDPQQIAAHVNNYLASVQPKEGEK